MSIYLGIAVHGGTIVNHDMHISNLAELSGKISRDVREQ